MWFSVIDDFEKCRLGRQEDLFVNHDSEPVLNWLKVLISAVRAIWVVW